MAYTLTVFHEDRPYPTETVAYMTAAEAMTAIRELLAKHSDCHRIHVHAGHTRLFSVDCEGNTVAN